MKFLVKFLITIKNFIFDLHPELDESHSITRYKETYHEAI